MDSAGQWDWFFPGHVKTAADFTLRVKADASRCLSTNVFLLSIELGKVHETVKFKITSSILEIKNKK